jgi:hypothetical protein
VRGLLCEVFVEIFSGTERTFYQNDQAADSCPQINEKTGGEDMFPALIDHTQPHVRIKMLIRLISMSMSQNRIHIQ